MYKELLHRAEEASRKAYCKYSRFAVGAALLTESGEIYTGCNIENISYPVGICAERVAFSKAVSEGHSKFKAIAIVGASVSESPDKPCYPCGMCRQFIREFCKEDFQFVLSDRIYTLQELLPFGFEK